MSFLGANVRSAQEDVKFPSAGDLTLRGCYLKTDHQRKGVILFGLEFGSNRWSCQPYCEPLLQAGYDIFAFEPRNQGDSDAMEGYEPLHWLTSHEVQDTHAAIRYLKKRPDADAKGIGFFGISKGANAGLLAASRDCFVRCLVTDGAFGTYSTMVPYTAQVGHRLQRQLLGARIVAELVLWNDRHGRSSQGAAATPDTV